MIATLVIAIVLAVLAILVADALYARRALRQRAAAQPQRPAFDLVRPSSGAWRPLGEEQADSLVEGGGEDLSWLFGGRGNGS
jgi:hypothetical protein